MWGRSRCSRYVMNVCVPWLHCACARAHGYRVRVFVYVCVCTTCLRRLRVVPTTPTTLSARSVLHGLTSLNVLSSVYSRFSLLPLFWCYFFATCDPYPVTLAPTHALSHSPPRLLLSLNFSLMLYIVTYFLNRHAWIYCRHHHKERLDTLRAKPTLNVHYLPLPPSYSTAPFHLYSRVPRSRTIVNTTPHLREISSV